MTTGYTLTDTLPKDLGGQKFGPAMIDDSTSQNDFALFRGIGVTPFGSASVRLGYMGIASHTVGSAIGNHGVLLMGTYTETASQVSSGSPQRIRVDKQGAVYIRGASATKSVTTASTQTHVSGSALVHGYSISLTNVNAGNSVAIEDGTAFAMGVIATAASQHFTASFPQPVLFTTSVRTKYTLGAAGAASITILYSQQ